MARDYPRRAYKIDVQRGTAYTALYRTFGLTPATQAQRSGAANQRSIGRYEYDRDFPRCHFPSLPPDFTFCLTTNFLERTTPLLGLSGPLPSLFFSPKSLLTHDDSNRRRHRPFAVEIHGPLVHGRSRFRVQQVRIGREFAAEGTDHVSAAPLTEHKRRARRSHFSSMVSLSFCFPTS